MEEVEINVDGLTDEIKSYELTPEQYKWFLLQATKVQELELDRNDWKDEAGKWNRRYHTSEKNHLETMEFLDSTSNQYKRLKEALEFYADGETYTDDRQYTSTGTLVHTGFTKIECDCGEKARRALKGEST
ncbi:hypothetical protein [Oceanobacillus sojae]|uniref:hypothetical protein n=1 Tax=Oceanobacillus sojae TaxID=582851 RepID=UPI0036D2D2D8